jgi:hypothetical protein
MCENDIKNYEKIKIELNMRNYDTIHYTMYMFSSVV